jgi:hypothetical protein
MLMSDVSRETHLQMAEVKEVLATWNCNSKNYLDLPVRLEHDPQFGGIHPVPLF